MSINDDVDSDDVNDLGDNKPGDRPRSGDFKSLYINNSVCGYSAWDIQVVCSRVQVTMTKEPKVEEVAVLTMSPRHAKAFIAAFASNLKKYEEQYGEILVIDNKKDKD